MNNHTIEFHYYTNIGLKHVKTTNDAGDPPKVLLPPSPPWLQPFKRPVTALEIRVCGAIHVWAHKMDDL